MGLNCFLSHISIVILSLDVPSSIQHRTGRTMYRMFVLDHNMLSVFFIRKIQITPKKLKTENFPSPKYRHSFVKSGPPTLGCFRRLWVSLSVASCLIPRLHDRANIEQTSSKHRANIKQAWWNPAPWLKCRPICYRLSPQLITCYINLPITTRPPS